MKLFTYTLSIFCILISFITGCKFSAPCRIENSSISEIVLTFMKQNSKTIIDEDKIKILINHFSEAEKIKPQGKMNWDYSIKIDSKDCASGIWLYSSEAGILSRLNYRLKPSFKLKDHESFNRQLKEIFKYPKK